MGLSDVLPQYLALFPALGLLSVLADILPFGDRAILELATSVLFPGIFEKLQESQSYLGIPLGCELPAKPAVAILASSGLISKPLLPARLP